MKTTLRLLLVNSCFLLGCGDETPTRAEPDPTATGLWTGTMSTGALSLVLEEAPDGSLSGGATLRTGPVTSIGFWVTGTHAYPDLVVELESQCAFCPVTDPWVLRATLDDDVIEGILDMEDSEESVTLARQ